MSVFCERSYRSHTSPELFAEFTFIGQLIGHDITFNYTPLDSQQADTDAKVDFRSPRYPLDSVYGAGCPMSQSFTIQ